MKKVIIYTAFYGYDDEEETDHDAKMELLRIIKESRDGEILQEMTIETEKEL